MGEGKGGVARRKTSIFDAENLGGGASQAFGIHIIVCQGGNFQPPEELGEGRTCRTWSDHDCEMWNKPTPSIVHQQARETEKS